MKSKIALIEDNPDNQMLVVALLEDDYDIEVFDDGVQALPRLIESPPDLILLDISLPQLSGVEVLEQIRADDRIARLPVIALTAHAMAGDKERFLSQGFDAFVSKPIVDEEHLFTEIGKLLV